MKMVEVRLNRWLPEYPDLVPNHKYRVSAVVADRLKTLGVLKAVEDAPESAPLVTDYEHDRVVE